MTSEEKAKAMVRALMHEKFQRMELTAVVSDHSYSVEFFVWREDGKKAQCYDLAEAGEIDGTEMAQQFKNYAEEIRNEKSYRRGEVNTIHVVCPHGVEDSGNHG